MKLKSAVSGLVLASAAFSARAEAVNLTYVGGTLGGTSTESFDLNTTAGVPVSLGPDELALVFAITNDTLGNDSFAVVAPNSGTAYGNPINTGSSSGRGWPSFFDNIIPGTLYDGIHPVLHVAPGDSFAGELGGTLTVAAAPEVSTWAMMLSGFVALGFVGYRRRVGSAA